MPKSTMQLHFERGTKKETDLTSRMCPRNLEALAEDSQNWPATSRGIF